MGSSSKRKAEQIVKNFEEVKKDITKFLEDNPQFDEVLRPMVEKYNYLRVEAKNQVRDLPGDEQISIGPFHRSKKPRAVSYVADQIKHTVLAIPGVVKEVNTKVIDQLILSGHIKHEDVVDGRREVYGTAKVAAPPLIQMKILD